MEETTNKLPEPFTTVINPVVRLWHDKDKKIYKIEIRGDNYRGYLNP